ncbi:MAG: HupE/UreJ family protein [Gemmobacter sp.]
MPARPRTATRPSMLPFALLLAALVLMIPLVALAHPGGHEGSAFASGLGHPVGGLDHVLAMVAVGLLAVMTGGRAVWAMPVAFVAAMLAGGVMGAVGLPVAGVEPMILASIVVLGVAVALAVRVPLLPVLAVIALFAVVHGHAHGAEGPSVGLAAYAAGFALATAGLHLAGIALGALLRRASAILPRVAGGGTALAGLALALG